MLSIEEMAKPAKPALRELQQEILINGKPASEFRLEEIRPANAWTVKIYLKPVEFCEDGLILVVDPKTGTIDFRKIFLMKLKNIDKLKFADGETIHTRDNRELPGNRPIFIFRLRDLLQILNPVMIARPIKGFREGEKISDQELLEYKISRAEITPALDAILNSLKNDVNI